MFYKTNVLDTCCTYKQDVIVVIKFFEDNRKCGTQFKTFT